MKKPIGIIVFFFALLFVLPGVVFAYPYFNDSESPTSQRMPCHSRELQDNNYEWYYTHLSREDQLIVDAKFITLLNEIDFNELDSNTQADALQDIKEQLVVFIIEMEFNFRERR